LFHQQDFSRNIEVTGGIDNAKDWQGGMCQFLQTVLKEIFVSNVQMSKKCNNWTIGHWTAAPV
jgi:hypothetical protein